MRLAYDCCRCMGQNDFVICAERDTCARMCAALGISTKWKYEFVRCSANEIYDDIVAYYDECNDRAAAWRMAALRVAAAIGAK